jgi:translation initiation factor IF-1
MATHIKKKDLIKKKNNTKKDIIFRSVNEDEHYATVGLAKGDARFEVTLIENNIIAIAKTRGALSKGPSKQRICKDDIVIVQGNPGSTQDKYYIIHKYSPEDVRKLRKSGELAQIKEKIDNEECSIMFEDDVVENKQDEIIIDDDFISNI